jgi:DNA-directed RNA polymerase specialized sigma54-like protein
MLRVIQGFDPAGIAARDLRECILLQLRDCVVQELAKRAGGGAAPEEIERRSAGASAFRIAATTSSS